jgi:hypothetical protein
VARRGIYRIRGTDGRPNDVRVDDDGIDLPLEEAKYIALGYLPRVGDLPWQEEYVARKPSAEVSWEAPSDRNGRANAGGWRPRGQR